MDTLLDFKRLGDLFLPLLNIIIAIVLFTLCLFNINLVLFYHKIGKLLVKSVFYNGVMHADNITFFLVILITMIYLYQHLTLWLFRKLPHFSIQPMRMHSLVDEYSLEIENIWKKFYSDILPDSNGANNLLIAILTRELQSTKDHDSLIFRIMYQYNQRSSFCMQLVGTVELLIGVSIMNLFFSNSISRFTISLLLLLGVQILGIFIILYVFKIQFMILWEQYRLYFLNKLQSGSKTTTAVDGENITSAIHQSLEESQNIWFQLQDPKINKESRKVRNDTSEGDIFKMYFYGLSGFFHMWKDQKYLRGIFRLLGFDKIMVDQALKLDSKSEN